MLEGLRNAFSRFVESLPVGEKEISEATLEEPLSELELSLIRADTALEAVEIVKNSIKQKLLGKKVRGRDELRKALREALVEILTPPAPSIFPPKNVPTVVLFVGPNGAGKTTTIGKVAWFLKRKGYASVFSASDTFRAGSIQQLEEWGKMTGAKVIKHDYGADPAAVAFDARTYAEKRKIPYVLIDTAGRQETNTNLMEQLRKIKKVVKPDLVVFVGEALAGNALLDQIKGFDEAVGVDAVILTKFDLDVKGGAAFTVTAGAGKPILFLGMGQRPEDLVPFSPEIVLERVLPTGF